MKFNTAKPEPKTIEKITTETVIKNARMDGFKYLRAEKITTKFLVKHELHPVTNEPFRIFDKEVINEEIVSLCLPLKEVTQEELKNYRKNEISAFVFKNYEQLYFTEIPKEFSFVNSNLPGTHMCAFGQKVCHRLSPLSDEKGGCAKVRNDATYIEDYPFISRGYETFNTKHDVLVVNQCTHFVKSPSRVEKSAIEINKSKLNLAQLYYSDSSIKNLNDVKRVKRQNQNKKNK